jgi:hypothetical protein
VDYRLNPVGRLEAGKFGELLVRNVELDVLKFDIEIVLNIFISNDILDSALFGGS